MVLVTGRKGNVWPVPPFGSLLQNQTDFICEEFESVYGIGETGAVLVRPDGYVAARFRTAPADPEGAVHEVLYAVLCK
jgi:hypothetical protein